MNEQCMWHLWGRGDMYTGFGWGNLNGRGHVNDIIIDDNKIDHERMGWGCGGMDWIDQALDGDKWWAVVNTVSFQAQ
jgi:hypothetical protein